MIELRFTPTLTETLDGARHLVVVGRKSDLKDGWAARGLPEQIQRAISRLLEDASPGSASSATATTLVDGEAPARVSVAVLHDKVSRHLSDARALEIGECIRQLSTPLARGGAILVALGDETHATGAAIGVGRGFPRYNRKTTLSSDTFEVTVGLRHRGGFVDALDVPARYAEAVRNSQRLVDTPPAELTTAAFEHEAREVAATLDDVTVSTIVGDDLLKEGLGGLHAVGRTAMVPPRLVILDYNPAGAKDTIALIGKGLVYDTGGLSLKVVGNRMLTMKCDMGGAAATLGAFQVLAGRKVGARVVCALCIAENAIGPDSYRPDDVLTMHSGHTVEINNTDAEGRLAIADGASYVARKYAPSILIDAATLTGAQLIATGKAHAGIVSNDADLEAAALSAGLHSGEHCLPMLFSPELMSAQFKSKVADMRNSVSERMNAQSAAAGQFVYMHIDDIEGLRWLHIDLAGPAYPGDGATGYGVGLIAETVISQLG